jgi:hypothetical protein
LALALLAGPASQAAPAWAQDYTAPRPQDAPWAGPGRAPQVAPASQAPQASQAAPPLEAFGGARGEGSLVSQERAPRPAGGDQESLPVAGEQPPATPAGLDLLDQGEFAAAAGRFEEAERIWRKALAQRPDWPEVKRRLAELPARRANFRPQLTEQHERREARLALVQGISDFNARRYREAEANILAFLRVFPEDAEGLYYLDLARAQGQAVGVGRLKVFCAPEAQVLLDGRPVGQTPLSLPAAPGVRRVEVRAHGGGQGQEVRVPAGGEAQVSFTLLGGFLAVNAQPWGQVYLDGKQVGQTPITLENLVLGPHTVTVRNPELPEQSQRVVLPLGETVSVQFNLEGR